LTTGTTSSAILFVTLRRQLRSTEHPDAGVAGGSLWLLVTPMKVGMRGHVPPSQGPAPWIAASPVGALRAGGPGTDEASHGVTAVTLEVYPR
jgi:hypothetical protein